MSPTVAAYASGITSADWTAIGTLALAVVTVAAVLTTIWLAREDRRRADKALAGEIKREHTRAEAERLKEQEAEAYLVEVAVDVAKHENPGSTDRRIAVIVINHSRYTITHIEAQYCAGTGGNPGVQPFGGKKQRITGGAIPNELMFP